MNVLYPFELVGTFFFAISGALAIQDQHDDLKMTFAVGIAINAYNAEHINGCLCVVRETPIHWHVVSHPR